MQEPKYAKPISSWFQYIYTDIWNQASIPETNDYFWIRGGPWYTWLTSLLYLYIVLKAGPDFMRNRKAYELKNTIRLYNFLLVFINTYLLVDSLPFFNFGLDTWGCSSAMPMGKDRQRMLLEYGHVVFYVRYLEFFDTFFLVLKKKNSQLTFLHIFHHAIVPTLMYIGLKFNPVPFNAMLPITNLFVHIIMYAYYGLSTFGPSIQKWLWWKQYLTTLQILQFVLLIVHSLHLLPMMLLMEDCRVPPSLVIVNTSVGLTFLTLFMSFYKKTYGRSRKSGTTSQSNNYKSLAKKASTKQELGSDKVE